jgi:glucosamine-6-phosphate deaminase
VERDDSVTETSTRDGAGASSSIELVVFDDQEWADRVAQRLVEKIDASPTSRVCLPTGETPRPMYMACAPLLDVTKATLFLLDEFGLPSNSPGRCDSMLQRDLLGSLTEPPGAYHRLDVDSATPDDECDRFDSLVADGGLDLTLLGLGGNGHLGLNEPGTPSNSPTRVTDLAPTTTNAVRGYDADAEAVGGMTLGLQRILESAEIWLLVTGSHKATVLERMLNGPITSDLPASFLRTHPNTVVYADQSAAGLL